MGGLRTDTFALMGRGGVMTPEEHLPSCPPFRRPCSLLTLEAAAFRTGSQDKPPAVYSDDRARTAILKSFPPDFQIQRRELGSWPRQ